VEWNDELRMTSAEVVNGKTYYLPGGGYDVSIDIFLKFDG